MRWIEFGPEGRQASAPDFRLRTPEGTTVARAEFQRRQHLTLCFVPASLSQEDHQRLRHLAEVQHDIAQASARLYLLAGRVDARLSALPVLLDVDSAIRQRYAALFPLEQAPSPDAPFVVIVDRYGAPAYAAVGIPPADEVLTRLWGLQYECPE